MKVIYSKSVPLLTVDKPTLLSLYHVSWALSNGVVGRCISIDDKNKTISEVPFLTSK